MTCNYLYLESSTPFFRFIPASFHVNNSGIKTEFVLNYNFIYLPRKEQDKIVHEMQSVFDKLYHQINSETFGTVNIKSKFSSCDVYILKTGNQFSYMREGHVLDLSEIENHFI